MSNSLALVIEDNRDLALIFAEAVRFASMEVEVIRDGEAALQRLRECVPALVILDLHLPGVSGKDLLAFIKSDSRLAATQIVIASADGVLVDELRDQVDLALEKPVGFEQLRTLAIRLQFQRKASRDNHNANGQSASVG
ncbi:MAG: hypothetical protein Kow0077_23670 [Anaerolineae bacterium]